MAALEPHYIKTLAFRVYKAQGLYRVCVYIHMYICKGFRVRDQKSTSGPHSGAEESHPTLPFFSGMLSLGLPRPSSFVPSVRNLSYVVRKWKEGSQMPWKKRSQVLDIKHQNPIAILRVYFPGCEGAGPRYRT